MGLRNRRGMCQVFVSSSLRIKKLLEPVASPRLMTKRSPSVGSSVLSKLVRAGNCVHLREWQSTSRGTSASVVGLSIGPAKEKRTRCPGGEGALRNTTTAEDTSASVNCTSVGQKR